MVERRRSAVFVGGEAASLVGLVVKEAAKAKEGLSRDVSSGSYEALSQSSDGTSTIALKGTPFVATLRPVESWREDVMMTIDEDVFAIVWAPPADEYAFEFVSRNVEGVLCCPTRDGRPTPFDDTHAAWCAGRGVEYVYLGDERDDGVPRILAALAEAARESPRPPPVKEEEGAEAASSFPSLPSSPATVVVGEGSAAVRARLRAAFPGAGDDALRIVTKYYEAEVAVVGEVPPRPTEEVSVDAIVLVASTPPEADGLWETLQDFRDAQTKVIVSSNEALDAWSVDRGFERVAPEDDPSLRTALRCTLWSAMDRSGAGRDHPETTPSLLDDAPTAGGEDPSGDFDIAQDFEDLMAVVKEARAGSQSDADRRERAADVALRLAKSLGIDDDDDDDD